MATRTTTNQISFRYRASDSTTGITRETAQRLAQPLGVDETQAIHRALHDLAISLFSRFLMMTLRSFTVRRPSF
jgi:hypothetical protein